MKAWFKAHWDAHWQRLNAPPQPTRVGVLNTGELVLVDQHGQAQVISADTTQVIRAVLAAGSSARPACSGCRPGSTTEGWKF